MSKPTDIELKTALIAAATMKEHNKDPFFIASTLLNLNYRLKHYVELLTASNLYMNHGQSEQARKALLLCIKKAEESESNATDKGARDFGL